MGPLFGAQQQGMPGQQAPPMAPTEQGMQAQPMGPQAAAPGAPVQPGPTEMALANQVYQLQQMVMQMQQQMADMHRRRVAMHFDIIRNKDGEMTGLTASEGVT